jgi:hypothetical protein
MNEERLYSLTNSSPGYCPIQRTIQGQYNQGRAVGLFALIFRNRFELRDFYLILSSCLALRTRLVLN